jgi:hypothetical protein
METIEAYRTRTCKAEMLSPTAMLAHPPSSQLFSSFCFCCLVEDHDPDTLDQGHSDTAFRRLVLSRGEPGSGDTAADSAT